MPPAVDGQGAGVEQDEDAFFELCRAETGPLAGGVEQVWSADGEDFVDRDGFEFAKGVPGANEFECQVLEILLVGVGVEEES